MDSVPTHQPPPRIRCRYRKCNASFSRKTDAHRHERQIHQPAKIFCEFAGCRFRGTVRAEVMRKHLKSKHPFDVESTFQIQNDFHRRSLPEDTASFESSSPIHKVDPFPSWNAGLPETPPSNNMDETEKSAETNMNMVYGDVLGNLNGLNGLPEANLLFPAMPISEYATYNQETQNHTALVEGQVPENITSCIIPGWNEASDFQEQYFRWQLGPWSSKDGWRERGNTLDDNSALYCQPLPIVGEALNLLGTSQIA